MEEAEAVLALFDALWLHPQIRSTPKTASSPNPNPQINQPSSPERPQLKRIHTRSRSEDLNLSVLLLPKDTIPSSSPDSVIAKPISLQTILSQKEFVPSCPSNVSCLLKKKKRGSGGSSKSMSELEFEEVKGFMDLGFVFSEEDKDDWSLVEIIPGLQRLGQEPDHEEEEEEEGGRSRRPYLSEAWDGEEEERRKGLMVKWRIPAVKNEVEMKDSLKWWAHTVASAVR